MAALLIAAAGSAIGGAVISGTVLGLSGATIGYLAGSLLASALIKGPNSQGPRLGDLRVQGTEYGAPIPWVAGGPRIAGQVAWASNRREIANTQRTGKGGGGSVTNYTYEVDLLILLTENESGGVARVWSNSELVYGAGETKSGVWASMEVYRGTGDQLPDPTYEAAVGIGNAPAYRGRTYVVITGLQLGSGGYIPNLGFEIGQAFSADTDSDYFYAGFSQGTTNDVACTSGVSLHQAIPGTTWSIDPVNGPLEVFNSGWSFNAVQARGYYYRWSPNNAGGTCLAGVALDVVFTAQSTPGATFVGSADIFYIARGPGGLASLPNTLCFCYVAIDAVSGQPTSVSLNVVGSGASTYALGAGDVRVTLYITKAGVVRFYVNTVFVSERTGAADLSTYDHLLLGGNTSTPSEVDDRGATLRYSVARMLVDPDLEVTTIALPVCSELVYGTAQPQPVLDVTADLLLRAGYDPTDFSVVDLAAITKPVRGMALGQVAATRGALETLQTAFFFEPSKSDKIYLRPRSTVPVASIPYDDLGAADNAASDAEPLELTVGSELEMPSQISLSYNNTAADYNVSTEHSDRLLSSQVSTQVVQLGLGMLPAEAKGVADGLLVDQLASLTRTTLRLPLKYAYIEPGDVFNVTNADGRVYRFRSTSKTDTLTTIEHQCVLDDAGALVSAAITSSNYALTDTVRQIAPTIWAAMDIPLLRDADNQAGFYVAMAPNRAIPEDQWDGGVFVRAWSADAFEQLIITGEACTMGACTNTLGSFASSGRFDEASTLTVRVTGQLANTTRADVLNDLDVNAAVVGSEIIRFRLATLLGTVDGENEYRLSGLLRGQRGTEQHMGTHTASERFVLLDAALRRVLNQSSQLGVASDVKAVTLNTVLSAVTAQPFTDTGVALMPFSVANLRCLQSGADLALSWQRRTRLSYRYGGTVGVSAPLGEAAELYRIDVFDGATLANTYTATDGAFTYTAAQIAADGFVSTDPIGFTVRQMSEIVGPGFPATVQGTAP